MSREIICHLNPRKVMEKKDQDSIRITADAVYKAQVILDRYYLVYEVSQMNDYSRFANPLKAILLPGGIHLPKSGTLPVFTKQDFYNKKLPFGLLYIGIVFWTTLPEIGDQMSWLGYGNISNLIWDYTRSEEKKIQGLGANEKLTMWEIAGYNSKPSMTAIRKAIERNEIEDIIQ